MKFLALPATIRAHLVSLVLVALVPVLGLSVALVFLLNQKEHDALERGTRNTARALLAAVDRELGSSITALNVLAASEYLDRDDLRSFYAEAGRVRSTQPGWVTIALGTRTGEQLINVLRPFGTKLPAAPGREEFEKVFATRRPRIGSLARGPITGQLQFPIRVPVIRDGSVKYVLAAVISTSAMGRVLQEQKIPRSWIGTIRDSRNVIVARTPNPDEFVGRPAALTTEMTAPDGWARGTTVDGVPSYVAYARSRSSGWTVALAVPASFVEGTLRRSLWSVAGAALLFTLIGGVMAMLIGRRIAQPLARLSASAEWLVRGDGPRFQDASVLEVDHLARAIERAGVERARVEEGARFLAEASRVLASSLDYEVTLQTIARLAVPHLADWCGVHIIETDGSIRCLAVAHSDATVERLGQEMLDRYPPRPTSRYGVPAVLRTGEPLFWPEFPDEVLQRFARRPEDFSIIRALGLKSVMIVPLAARNRTIGTLTFVTAESGRRYADADLRLAQDLAQRAAIAVDNARLFVEAEARRREAETANRSKDEFLAVLSHELRTPLQPMLGWSRLLLEGALDADEKQRAIESIERNTTAQARIIEDLLDISRIVLGKLTIDLRPVDLAAVIESALEATRPAARAKNIEITVDAGAPVTDIAGDPDRLRQVLSNLLSNAIKFTPSGGAVSIRLERLEQRARITVRDTGIGIQPEVLPHIFERFRQADSSSTRAHGGLGIGLAIVQHLVERHHGTVIAESPGHGQGSTFILELPLSESLVGRTPVA